MPAIEGGSAALEVGIGEGAGVRVGFAEGVGDCRGVASGEVGLGVGIGVADGRGVGDGAGDWAPTTLAEALDWDSSDALGDGPVAVSSPRRRPIPADRIAPDRMAPAPTPIPVGTRCVLTQRRIPLEFGARPIG